MSFFLAFLTSLVVGVFFFPVLIKILIKFDISDRPGGRRIHQNITPSMGGIGFLVATFIALGIWGWQFPIPDIRYLLGAIALMFFVGLRDDMAELKAKQKLLGQCVAVLLVVVAGDIRIRDFHGFLGIDEIPLLVSYGFSAFVLLALTNAFNLIDGLDGLAGSIASISLTLLGSWFYIQGLESFAVLSFCLLGSVLAFMLFNWAPAKIFMGDTGSLTLGFSMGSLVIAFMEQNSILPEGAFLKLEPSFSAGIVLMIYPLYDMARVFTKRISQGRSPMSADRSHVHHFLLRMGLRHDQVTLLLAFLHAVLILCVFGLGRYSDNIVLPILTGLVLVLGYQLERVTLQRVKKKVKKSPRVLERKPLPSPQKLKIHLEQQSVKSGSMNIN